MLMGAVIPLPALPYLKSRSKEAMVGLLRGEAVSAHAASLHRDFAAVG